MVKRSTGKVKRSIGNDKKLKKICVHFKVNLKDALNQLDAISNSKHRDIPKYVAVLKDKLGDVKKYADEVRCFAMDEESLPKSR
jgi:hypothetical protein